MNDNNDKWLEKIIFKTINTNKPEFDAEKFKQKFPDELEILKSRALNQHQRPIWWKSIFNDPVSSLTTAAVLILMVGIFVFFSNLNNNTKPQKVNNVQKSHNELLTSTAMMNAYLKGGMEAVDEQNWRAAKTFNQKPEEITIHKLLSENSNI